MKSDNELIKVSINQIKSKDKFANLRSDFFIKILFDYLNNKKLLYIVKYNKLIKKRINININNYKEYSEKYSSIEIEIKTVNNKYGQFINIKKENEKYYHIYFNNNKEEIKRNYLNKNENVEKLKIIIDYQIKSFKGLFAYCRDIEYFYFKNFIEIILII